MQAVPPGATATEFWAIAGAPVEHLPSQIVMPAEEMVDASLVGFDQGGGPGDNPRARGRAVAENL